MPSKQARIEQLVRRVETGEYLREVRELKGKSLKDVSENLSLSTSYLSEIERGVKEPSDHLVREIAQYYQIEEDTVFEMLGRTPLSMLEEIKVPSLRKLLDSIRKNPDISDERRYEIYESLYRTYKTLLDD